MTSQQLRASRLQIDSKLLCLDFTEKGADRLSDESSKKADSDSHPENWTDHEHSDPQQPAASSPPKSSEEKNKVSSSN